MKRQLRFFWITAAILTAVLVCAGCGEGLQNYVPNSGAKLTGLSITKMDGSSLIIPIPPELNPINGDEWDDEDFNLLDADIGTAPLQRNTDTVNVRLNPSVSPGARVLWGIGSQGSRPFKFIDRRVNATFEDMDYLYFKVTSEDGETTNYYRFIAWVQSPVTEISEVYIGRYETHPDTSETGTVTTVVDVDERIMASIEKAYPDLPTAIKSPETPGVLSIRTEQSPNAEIKVTRYDTNATLRYGIASGPSAEPEWKNSSTFNLTHMNYLYVEVTAENTVDKAYYKFRIEVGNIASIKTFTFVGKDGAEFDVANTGTRSGTWSTVAPGSFNTADMPDDGFGVKVVPDDER